MSKKNKDKSVDDVFSSRFWSTYSAITILNAVTGIIYILLVLMQLSGYNVSRLYLYCLPFAITSIIASTSYFRLLPTWAKFVRRFRYLEKRLSDGFFGKDAKIIHQMETKKREEDLRRYTNENTERDKSNMERINGLFEMMEEQTRQKFESLQSNVNVVNKALENIANQIGRITDLNTVSSFSVSDVSEKEKEIAAQNEEPEKNTKTEEPAFSSFSSYEKEEKEPENTDEYSTFDSEDLETESEAEDEDDENNNDPYGWKL